ncbi:OmpA family protein [Nonomuraea fuscirosea]|uniref:OmpA family protein n=1 Tax=Nonomuraea fuscirosea TaxID=1291556 RepID=UPI00342CC710
MRAIRGAAAVLAAAVLVGCGGVNPPTPDDSPPPSKTAATRRASPSPASAFTGEGLAGYDVPAPFRVEVEAVERHAGLTAMKMVITTTAGRPITGDFGYDGLRGQSVSFGRFRLLDPVAGKVYFTLRENDVNGIAFGTRHSMTSGILPDEFRPGVRYPVEVYFPPLPAGVARVSMVPDLPMAPMTGLPVTEGAGTPAAKERGQGAEPSPGTEFQWPVVPPSGAIWSGVSDVNELVEAPQRTKRRQGGKETVGLRTDVLFAFDKATLSAKATAVLDDAVRETRERADPAKPPITVEGHTDSKGDDAYNQNLSVWRAEAVRDYLAGKLGSGYTFQATGKGESEPIAKNEKPGGGDNPEGRARNRRVEISYQIKQDKPDVTVTTGPPSDIRGSTRPPAPFHQAGPVAGSLGWQRGQDRLRVDFHPFHRDGAYLLATFDVVSEGASRFIPVPAPFTGWDSTFSAAADFGAFILVDPATKTRYHPLKMYTEFVENWVPALDAGMTGRGYVYYPAPADTVSSVTVEAENLGRVQDIPIS